MLYRSSIFYHYHNNMAFVLTAANYLLICIKFCANMPFLILFMKVAHISVYFWHKNKNLLCIIIIILNYLCSTNCWSVYTHAYARARVKFWSFKTHLITVYECTSTEATVAQPCQLNKCLHFKWWYGTELILKIKIKLCMPTDNGYCLIFKYYCDVKLHYEMACTLRTSPQSNMI
jgi:hypothetical protein